MHGRAPRQSEPFKAALKGNTIPLPLFLKAENPFLPIRARPSFSNWLSSSAHSALPSFRILSIEHVNLRFGQQVAPRVIISPELIEFFFFILHTPFSSCPCSQNAMIVDSKQMMNDATRLEKILLYHCDDEEEAAAVLKKRWRRPS